MPACLRARAIRAAVPALPLTLSCLLAAPTAAQVTGGPEIRQHGDIAYLTGGIGEGEREAIEQLVRGQGFNFKLVLATREGTFLADVPVRLTSPDGTLLLEATVDGPWLLARLPAGRYRVEAEFAGGSRAVTVTVPRVGRREIVLAAPPEPSVEDVEVPPAGG